MSATNNAREEKVSRATDFMAGLLCGAVAGTVAGLLVATKPGAELRGEIASSAQRFRRRVGETYTHTADAVTEAVARGREAFNKGRESLDKVRGPYDIQPLQDVSQATGNRY